LSRAEYRYCILIKLGALPFLCSHRLTVGVDAILGSEADADVKTGLAFMSSFPCCMCTDFVPGSSRCIGTIDWIN
jgi:hypothetical protein